MDIAFYRLFATSGKPLRPAARSAPHISRVFQLLGLVAIGFSGLANFYSWLPTPFSVEPVNTQNNGDVRAGLTTTDTLIRVVETMLDKRGGFLSNDVLPPVRLGASHVQFMDDVPSWEYGVLLQSRDLVRSMREKFSRNGSSSVADPDVVTAQNHLFFDHRRTFLPSAESQFSNGLLALRVYRQNLYEGRAVFSTRADDLSLWLSRVESHLGDLSQKLSASRGKRSLQLDGGVRSEGQIKTPWLEVDNVFFEARGQTWALLHFFAAVQIDFEQLIEEKGGEVQMEQIIRELERTQGFIWMPFIMNGDGFGATSNHSYTMAKHISRAQSAISDLRALMRDG